MHENEKLTDNSKIDYCVQCKNCKHWGNGNDNYSNTHTKACCDVFAFPGHKPDFVLNNTGKCPFKSLR